MKKWFLLLGLVVFLFLSACSAPIETRLIKNFTGTGYQNTAPFTIENKPWAVSWAHNPEPYELEFGIDLFFVIVYDARTGLPVDAIVSSPGKYSGSNYIYATGTFYLAITGSNWVVKVYANQ